MANPFSLPGRPDPREPLDPIDRPQDTDDLYLDMDNTEKAFRAFQREFDKPEDLIKRGRLVIVAGREGCGKTALINRCAHWIESKLDEAKLAPVVVDLRAEATEAQTIDERMRSVCRQLTDHLRANNLLTDSNHFDRWRESPGEAYRNLDGYLQPGAVVIALLPPSELGDELAQYAGLSRKRLLFFGEIREWVQVEAASRLWASSNSRKPTLLEVGPLHEGHGWDFVKLRMAASGVHGAVPSLSEETLTWMTTSRPISIGELQGLLYEIYQELLTNEEPPAEVTRQDLLEFFYRTAHRGNRN